MEDFISQVRLLRPDKSEIVFTSVSELRSYLELQNPTFFGRYRVQLEQLGIKATGYGNSCKIFPIIKKSEDADIFL